MNDIHVRFTFDDTSDYRFLEVDASAAPQLRAILQQATATTVSDPLYINTVQSDPVAAASSAGPAYLCIPPNTCLSLRKVEYSNSLFLSRDITTSTRKRDRTDDAASLKEEDEKGHEPSSAPVVQRAQTWEERLHRVFECVPSRPHVSTALELLAKNFMTLDELESASSGGETFAAAGGATHGRKSGYYTLIDLLRVIPCTFAQLTKFLVDQGAVVYRGFVRLLHPLIVRECLASVLLQVESDRHRLTVQPQQQQRQEGEEGGGVAASPSSSCLIVRWDRLVSYFCPSIYPTIVLDVVQRVYTDAVDEMPAAENNDPVTTNEAPLYRKLRLGKCLIVLAEKIFQSSLEDEATMFGSAEGMQEEGDGDDEVWGTRSATTSGKSSSQQTLKDGWMNLPEFVTQWRSKMPISVLKADMFRTVLPTPSSAGGGGPSDDALDVALLLPLLRGCVVVRQQGSGIAMTSQIRWCAAAALPPRIPDRLRSLFAFTGENSRWQAADLKPFIEPLLEPGVTFEQSVNKVLKDHRMPGAPVSYSLLS